MKLKIRKNTQKENKDICLEFNKFFYFCCIYKIIIETNRNKLIQVF